MSIQIMNADDSLIELSPVRILNTNTANETFFINNDFHDTTCKIKANNYLTIYACKSNTYIEAFGDVQNFNNFTQKKLLKVIPGYSNTFDVEKNYFATFDHFGNLIYGKLAKNQFHI